MGLDKANFSRQNLIYAKGIISKNLMDYNLYMMTLKPPLNARGLPKPFLDELENFELKFNQFQQELDFINKMLVFPDAETLFDDVPKFRALLDKWFMAYE